MLDLLNTIGGCVLYHDYRSGSYRDWSGNGNDGVPTATSLTRAGADFHSQSQLITVPYDTSVDLGNYDAMTTVYLLADTFGNLANSSKRFHEQLGGIFAYIENNEQAVAFGVDGIAASLGAIGASIAPAKCFAFDWADGAAPNFYTDGAIVGAMAPALNKGSDNSDVVIGNRAAAGRVLGQTVAAVLWFSKALTATEHAQVYAALEAQRWPSKVTAHTKSRVTIDPAESGLVLGLDMRPVGGTVYDQSSYGNDGAGVNVIPKNTILGNGLTFNGASSYIDLGDPVSLRFTGAFTLAAWVKTPSKAVRIFSKDDGSDRAYLMRIDTTSGEPELTIFRSGGAFTIEADTAIDDDKWHNVVGVNDGTDLKIYVDGTLAGTNAGNGGAVDPDTVNLEIGRYEFGAGSEFFNGEMLDVKTFNVAKDQAWVTAEYQKGAQTVTYKTDWAARETTAAVAAPNYVGNTPWEVITGTHSIDTDTIEGVPVKVLKCVTGGVVAIPSSLFRVGDKGAARGTFRFWAYWASGTAPYFEIIGNQATGPGASGFDGYTIRLLTDGSIQMRRFTNGSGSSKFATATGYAAVDTWHKIGVTVGDGGVFTGFLNGAIISVSGGSGTNPFTDATHAESKFFVVDLDAGDMIALGDVNGNYAIEHMLGVTNEH